MNSLLHAVSTGACQYRQKSNFLSVGAEIFSERARALICAPKISASRWLEAHMLVHKVGLRSNATMLYGHVETP